MGCGNENLITSEEPDLGKRNCCGGITVGGCRFHWCADGCNNPSSITLGAELSSKFDQACQSHASISGATFGALTVGQANLSYANFTRADLNSSLLDGVNVEQTDFRGAMLNIASVVGQPAHLPTGWSIVAGHLDGPFA